MHVADHYHKYHKIITIASIQKMVLDVIIIWRVELASPMKFCSINISITINYHNAKTHPSTIFQYHPQPDILMLLL